jgi:hypothetical protein
LNIRSLGDAKLQEGIKRLHRNDVFLEVLDLDNVDFGDNSATLFLTSICLNGSIIGDKGAVELAKVLQVNEPLTAISLSGNKIGDKGAAVLAKALQVSKF